jgi:hypothetical protein
MIPLPFLSLLSGSSPWRKVALILAGVLLVLALCGVVGWKAYRAGYAKAEALGAAELARVREDYARAEAAGQARARQLFEQAVARRDVAENQYRAASRKLDAATRELSARRISDAAQAAHGRDGGPCVFDPDFVRLVNQALGLAGGDRPLPGSSPGAPGGADASGASAARVLPGASESGAVSAEDLLAFLRDFGAYSRDLSARLDAWRAWALAEAEARP